MKFVAWCAVVFIDCVWMCEIKSTHLNALNSAKQVSLRMMLVLKPNMKLAARYLKVVHDNDATFVYCVDDGVEL
jgi:hypothetical protein